jgi:hypothetical protein
VQQRTGARFEALERLPPADRPTHFAYYTGWLPGGSLDLFGPSIARFASPPPIGPGLAGGWALNLYPARLDLLDSGAAPLDAQAGWEVVDELDSADLVSERQHDWHGDIGRREVHNSYDGWTCYYSTAYAAGPTGERSRQVADGCRTIRGPGGERFTLHVDPRRPARLLVRIGGPREISGSYLPEPLTALEVETGTTPPGPAGPHRTAPARARAARPRPRHPRRHDAGGHRAAGDTQQGRGPLPRPSLLPAATALNATEGSHPTVGGRASVPTYVVGRAQPGGETADAGGDGCTLAGDLCLRGPLERS